MNTKQIFVTALLLAAGSASAKELNAPMALEASSRGGSKLLSLDFESDGNAASFSFRVVFPEGAKSIDTSRCLSELPKGFVGVCKVYDGKVVAVTVMNTEGGAFPAGLNSIGKLAYSSNSKNAAVIDTFEASNRDGNLASMGVAKVEKLD
ncbi:MAG TPA: hypothetical protein PLQ74_00790 [Pseudomonadota bacterium]|nr:hypothetical protein [Rhodanobacteraceae bacterium]HQW80383.1 hypothetical protein [Pseudomonadota bacterium]